MCAPCRGLVCTLCSCVVCAHCKLNVCALYYICVCIFLWCGLHLFCLCALVMYMNQLRFFILVFLTGSGSGACCVYVHFNVNVCTMHFQSVYISMYKCVVCTIVHILVHLFVVWFESNDMFVH